MRRHIAGYALLILAIATFVIGVAPKLAGGHFNRTAVILAPVMIALSIIVLRREKRAH